MKSAHCSYLAVAVLILMYALPAYALNVGDPFPDFTVANSLTPEQCAYLKVPAKAPVQLSAIPYDVVIVEFLNVYCHTCRCQVRNFQ